MKSFAATLALLGLAGSTFAAPGFDRPGTAFNPEVLAPGSIAWEQALPDVTRDKSGGVSTTLADYDSRLRFGLAKHLEVQVYGTPYAILSQTGNDATDGPGNTGLAFKVSLPTQSNDLHVGLMAALDFNTGKHWFRNIDNNGKEARQAYVGLTSSWNLGERQSFSLYGDLTRIHKDDVYTFSPSWNYAINDAWGAYLEYKVSFGDQPDNDNLAGGGLTWMATDKLQLDVYSNVGLTSASTDLEAGFGLSWLIR